MLHKELLIPIKFFYFVNIFFCHDFLSSSHISLPNNDFNVKPVIPPNFKPTDAAYSSKQSPFHSPLPCQATPIAQWIPSSHSDVAMVQSGDALVATTVQRSRHVTRRDATRRVRRELTSVSEDEKEIRSRTERKAKRKREDGISRVHVQEEIFTEENECSRTPVPRIITRECLDALKKIPECHLEGLLPIQRDWILPGRVGESPDKFLPTLAVA